MSGLTLNPAIAKQMNFDAYLYQLTNLSVMTASAKLDRLEERIEDVNKQTYIRHDAAEVIRKQAKAKQGVQTLIKKGLENLSFDHKERDELFKLAKYNPLLRKSDMGDDLLSSRRKQIEEKVRKILTRPTLNDYPYDYTLLGQLKALQEGVNTLPTTDMLPIFNRSTEQGHKSFACTVNEIAWAFNNAHMMDRIFQQKILSEDELTKRYKAEDRLPLRIELANYKKQLGTSLEKDELRKLVSEAIEKVAGFKEQLLNTGSTYILHIGGIDAMDERVAKEGLIQKFNEEDRHTGVLCNGEGLNLLGQALMEARERNGGQAANEPRSKWKHFLKTLYPNPDL